MKFKIIGAMLGLVISNVLANTVVEMPSFKGNWTFELPINMYCKESSRVGYFKSKEGWKFMNFPVDKDSGFSLTFKDWKKLSAEELKACNIIDDKFTEAERNLNWKICGIRSYPSKSTRIFPSVCTPMKTKEGNLSFKCDEDTWVDVDGATVLGNGGVYGFIFVGASTVDMSTCTRVD